MTRYACLSDTAVIEFCNRPIARGMTGFAICLGRDVIGGLARRHDIIVTTGTAFGRALKHTTLMTCIARYLYVRPGERKTG